MKTLKGIQQDLDMPNANILLNISILEKSEWKYGGTTPEVVLYSSDRGLIMELKDKLGGDVLKGNTNYVILFGNDDLIKNLETTSTHLKTRIKNEADKPLKDGNILELKKRAENKEAMEDFNLQSENVVGVLKENGFIRTPSPPKPKQ
jgi:hypothetical protein